MLGSAGLIVGLATAIPATAAPAAAPTASYVVQLVEAPAAAYTGGVAGYARTKPAAGAKIDANAPAVRRYRGYLTSRQDGVLRQARAAAKIHEYSITFNGFAAELTAADAAKLARTPGVKAVRKDQKRKADTTRTPEFLGLTKPGGLWDQLGGPGRRGAGSGVVVGVIDTGLWPESPSLAPLRRPGAGAAVRRYLPDRRGLDPCGLHEQDRRRALLHRGLHRRHRRPQRPSSRTSTCPRATRTVTAPTPRRRRPATTASRSIVDGTDFGRASGMAPQARVATYKVCWGRVEHEAGCVDSDSVQAIEDATADGVDVINYSISGSLDQLRRPGRARVLRRRRGRCLRRHLGRQQRPGRQHRRAQQPVADHGRGRHATTARPTKSVTLGNGATYTGVGLGAGGAELAAGRCPPRSARPAPTGERRPALLRRARSTRRRWPARSCVCDRGVNARIDKSQEVKRAGGVGMVLTNTTPNSLNADLHFVPTVHVDDVAGAAIKAYVAATAAPTASLSAGELSSSASRRRRWRAFSSRGPALAGGGDLLKPDIMAPGVDVLAGVSPDGHDGRLYDFISGTSMSSPHIAGIAALLIQKHPTWSPMAIKSALMTTAPPARQQGPADHRRHRRRRRPARTTARATSTPNLAADPGLVYDSGAGDWVRFLCGVGAARRHRAARARCSAAIDPSDLNTPNIAIGALAGTQTVTRTVTNVGRRSAIYVAFVQEPAGVDVTVTPSRIRLQPGGKASFRVSFTRTSAAFGEYALGSLTWSDGRHRVRSQIAVQPGPGGRAGRGERHRHLGLRRDRRRPGVHRHADDLGGRPDPLAGGDDVAVHRGAGVRPGSAGGQQPDGQVHRHDPGGHPARPALHLRR